MSGTMTRETKENLAFGNASLSMRKNLAHIPSSTRTLASFTPKSTTVRRRRFIGSSESLQMRIS